MSELSPGSGVPPRRLRDAIDALRYPDFAKFWAGALISNCGVWMQNITVPYVIYQSTGSASLVGFAAFCQFFPTVFVGPVGGWLADRHSRRGLLLVTQLLQAGLALVLWLAYVAGFDGTPVLIVVVAASGVVQGLNVPAWQSFVTELVPRGSLLNAMTLNSAQFNAARAIGPGIAGLVLGRFGPSWAFLLNALSYGAVIIALVAISGRKAAPIDRSSESLVVQFGEGLRYVRQSSGIMVALTIVCIASGLGQPLLQLIPVFAEEVYHVEAWRFGLMAAALGIGGVCGAVLLGVVGSSHDRSTIVKVALSIYAVALIAFASTTEYLQGLATLFVAGICYIAIQALLNTSVQMQVPDHLRGRVLATYAITFNIAYPIGALMQGVVAELVGPRWTVAGCGCAIFAATSLLRLRRAFRVLDDDLDEALWR